jgi:hypothetical protein
MYIEEAKKERFVSFTGQKTKSSHGSDWMPQFECIIVHNHASVALWLIQQLRFTLTVAYEAAWHSQILVFYLVLSPPARNTSPPQP